MVGQASPSSVPSTLAEITPSRLVHFELEAGALRIIGCDVDHVTDETLKQAQFFTIVLYLECLSGTIQPFQRDLMVSLGGVDISRIPIATNGKQPGEVFKISRELYVPRCVKPGLHTLGAGLVRENGPGEGRRGLTNQMGELARFRITSAPPPKGAAYSTAGDRNPTPNLLNNGGFEAKFDGWTVATDLVSGKSGWFRVLALQRDDTVAREGIGSLHIAFGGGQDPNFYHMTQVIPIKPATRYQVSYWVKTEELHSKSLPLVAVGDADRAPTVFYRAPEAASLTSGTTNWTRVTYDFITPDFSRRLVVRISRSGSGPELYDPDRFGPISGSIWFDDIRLSELRDASQP